MKSYLLLLVCTILIAGCSNSRSSKQEQVSEIEKAALTVDELYENAKELEGSEILVKGTVMHVCKEGGERCFIMGSNEDIIIRIEAGEKIGAFDQELMGSDIEVAGVLKQVRLESEAHNPGAHNEDKSEMDSDQDTDAAHQVIEDSQEDAEIVYYIEGLKLKGHTNVWRPK